MPIVEAPKVVVDVESVAGKGDVGGAAVGGLCVVSGLVEAFVVVVVGALVEVEVEDGGMIVVVLVVAMLVEVEV